MGGGILQIAANTSNDSLFNDQNYTFFISMYHRYTPFSIENSILNLTSLSDFGKKIETVIPKIGDLLTDLMLVIDLPEISGEYIFTNREDYLASLQNQYSFTSMNDIQQYNENLYKLSLGSSVQAYLVRDSVLGQYQLVLPLLDATMFLIKGQKQKYSLTKFLQNNSQFFDNQYKLHTIKDLVYGVKTNTINIDYLNYSFQDKEFYFFIANLLNIKTINPNLNIVYFDKWQVIYKDTIKKYILKRPEIVAMNTFIENMNTQISNSTKINNYVFDYESIFTINPLDYQYEIVLPISFDTNYFLTFLPYENINNNKNNLYDYTSSFFSIFNRNYIIVKRNNNIIGALTIKSVKDTSPIRLTVEPFRHYLVNNTISANSQTLYIYYGITTKQVEPINFATISSIKNNINNYTEFLIDRLIDVKINDIIIVGINPANITPINNYNMLYGIFKIINHESYILTVSPIEIDQLLLSDTLLINTNTNITTNTIFTNYNSSFGSTFNNTNDFVNIIKNDIYTDVTISSIIDTDIKSISEKIMREIVFSDDFTLTSSSVNDLTTTTQNYIYDSYDVLYNYLSKIYNKTIIKSSTNQDFLNNIYFKIKYINTNGLYSFFGTGDTTFINTDNGIFRYQEYIIKTINTHVTNDGQYIDKLSYINFLTTHILDNYQILANDYINQWSISILNLSNNLSDNFIKILNYLQYNNQNGRKTILSFVTSLIPIQKTDLTQLSFNYYKQDVNNTNISDYYFVSNVIPINLLITFSENTISFDQTSFILEIQDSFNLEYIDFNNAYFEYTTSTTSGIITISSLSSFLDNYSNDLIPIINSVTPITTQLYGNNILLDYINIQHESIFGYMKNYELSRKLISRIGGTKYITYQEDTIDQTPLLVDGSYIIQYKSDEYYPRFVYSKQTQIYQNIYQKIKELSENYLNESSNIYFLNNINYPRTDGYNYRNNNEGPISFIDPNQLPLLLEPIEYSYNLLDKVSKHQIYVPIKDNSNFSFMRYLSELEEHVISDQNNYSQIYWNDIFITKGINTTTINNYITALSGKDDGLLMYYIYKYLVELYTQYNDSYNISINTDDTYFKTIYQLSPDILSKFAFNTFSSIMNTTTFSKLDQSYYYVEYNKIIQNNQDMNTFKILYSSYSLLPEYNPTFDTNFLNQASNMINEFSSIFYFIAKLSIKHSINLVLNNTLNLSNYPIINKIHGSGNLVKIILVSDQYIINNTTNSTFTSSIVYPTGYHVNDYYKVFNLSIHYDYLKYLFYAGYGGILRDTQYPNKTLTSFYQKINNYITTNINTTDFAFFYAKQSGLFLPNMEGNIIQSYEAWITRKSQPYFYYYNTLSIFYDMFFIYSGRNFISEYYTKNETNTVYNNRPDQIKGETVYATRMAYGTRDEKGRLNSVGTRYNLLDQRLYSIIDTYNAFNIDLFDMNDDPIQIIEILTILNKRFTDYQEFLTLLKYSININNPYPNNDKYLQIITQFKTSSIPMTDLVLHQSWNTYMNNYATEQNYTYSSIISGLTTTINQYTQLSSNILDLSSIGYELHSFMNMFYQKNQRNFSDSNLIKYLSNSNYHEMINDFNNIITSVTYFNEKDNLLSDYTYRTNNYTLIQLDFIELTIDNIMGIYQSDVSVFKELFKNILNYRQKTVSTETISIDEKKLQNDYNSINDVTSVTFYDKFFRFSNNVDYHLIPIIYHELYNIQNASKTVVFYLNYLYSFLSNKSIKPNIADYDNPNLNVSYYFLKYLSSGVDYFLSNFHQLLINYNAFYPYKSVPSTITLYNGNIINRPKIFMYVFLLLKIQFRNYYYSFVDPAYTYIDNPETNIREITGLNTFSEYPDIANEIASFDNIIDIIAVRGKIDHLQSIQHPFFVNKHIDNLLFIKDLLLDLTLVSDNAPLSVVLSNNDKYVEFLSERTILTNAFNDNGLIFGGYPYTLGVLSDYNYQGSITMIDPNGVQVQGYIEGNVVLSTLITKIYYYLLSECFLLNQNELIGSSFQLTPMSLGNTLSIINAKEWKKGLTNLISEYLFLLLKSKKIIYQNSIYEITYNDLYTRLYKLSGEDRLTDILDMFINSLLNITINVNENQETYLGEYEQFKIPNEYSLITIKNNYNYADYYRLMFALRQSLIGRYNNFEERVQFHNAYDYWKENNEILISDYTEINFDNIKYMVRNTESENIINGLTYYSTNTTNIPSNLFTTIIDYIIGYIKSQNTINTKYNFKAINIEKTEYNVTLTLYNVYFTNINEQYNILINTGSKTITANVVQGYTGNPFTISYNNLPFGYDYDLTENKLRYAQLLYQYDITNVLENMFTVYQNIQDILKCLNVLSTYSTPTSSNYTFIHFPTFIESFIYYDFSSQTDPTVIVNAVILPVSVQLNTRTLFNLILINWSEFYGQYYYVYSGYTPTESNFLGSGTVIFNNGDYNGSLYLTFSTSGKNYISITNALIDSTHPFGSSSVAVNIQTPITVSNISDGSLDTNYAIITIPRTIKITLFGWTLNLNISELYTFIADNPNATNLKNSNGDLGIADGPFSIEQYFEPQSNVPSYRVVSILTFPIVESVYIYVSDKQNVTDLDTAKIFTLIPNISHSQTVNVVNDITTLSKQCVLSSNVSLFGVNKTYTLTLINWTSLYQINKLYVYLADNINGLNLGNDSNIINQPQAYADIILSNNVYTLSFDALFKQIGNTYIYLTYNPISDTVPYGSRPVNFLTNITNPIVTAKITNVTGVLTQYIAIQNQQTTFKVTLGNWLPNYSVNGINKLYIYTRDLTLPDIYTNYIPINNLPNVNYSIVLENNKYVLYFTTTFTNISQQYVYLTFIPISSTNIYGSGVINVQITNPPGDLVSFNYIDVIPSFYTDYVTNTLITYTTNLIKIHVNNYSSNYNIYKDIPNLLYIFLSTTNNSTNIYTDGIPIVFDQNSILNYNFYTISFAPVYIFVSDSAVYGNGLINYGAGFLVNQIGSVNALVNQLPYIINNKQTNYNIQLTNWNASYNISSLVVYLSNDPNTSLITLGEFNISFANNIYSLIFSTSFPYIEGTYNLCIRDRNRLYLKQLITPTVNISNQISIKTLTSNINPIQTYLNTIYTGSLNNWKTYFTPSLRVFIDKTLTSSSPVNQYIVINNDGTFSFTAQTTKYPNISIAFSNSNSYGSGYLETESLLFNTFIGPINARFDVQSYVLTTKPTNYSILLPNWDITYGITQLYVYIYDGQLLWNYGLQPITNISGQYYIRFTATITGLSTGSYNVYISDRNYNITGYKILQQLTNQLSVISQISLNQIIPSPSPFKTYVSTTFTGYINDWLPAIYPSTMYVQYITLSNNVKQSVTVNVNSSGVFVFTATINTLPGITIGISDNATYGNGYIETQQITLNNIIGPVSTNLTTTRYALLNKLTSYNFILTNWNTSYNISNLYIYLGTNINTPVYSYGLFSITSGVNFTINFTNTLTSLTPNLYNIYLSDQDPYGIVTPLVNQLISTFNVNNQISISTITPSPSPFKTYTSTILSGTTSNWYSNYPSNIYLNSTIRSSNVVTQTYIPINNDGTFSYTITNNTLPGITLSLSDNTTYGSGYIESPVFTLTEVIGPVNASFNNVNFIQSKTLSTTLTLTNWNSSYNINSLYVYVGSNINTSIESYGLKTISLQDSIYSITFSITSSLSPSTYTVYISDTDPTVTGLSTIRQAVTTQITILSQIQISSITTNPTPFKTYTSTTFNGTLIHWSSSYTIQMYVVFYSVYDNQYIVNYITINSNGTFSFSFTENYLSDFIVYISDNLNPVYGDGYYESQKYTLTPTYGSVNSTLTTLYAIKNTSSPININISNWNASYGISSLYVYIGTDKNTPVSVFGQKSITYVNPNYVISFNQSIGVNAGAYNIYVSDTNPSISNTYLIREQIANQLIIINQIQISSITTNPTPLKTYTSTVYSGSFTSWSNVLPLQLYVFLGKTITNSTTYDQIVSINNSGQFSFTSSKVIDYNNINVGFSDTTIYSNGFLKSPFYNITSKIGPINGTITPTIFTVSVENQFTITLTNWNDSYGFSQLYIFSSTDQSFSNLTLINASPVSITVLSNVYTLVFNNTFPTIGPYYFVISDVNNPQSGTYNIYQTVNTRLINANLSFSAQILKITPEVYNPSNVSNLIIQYDASEIDGTYLDQPNNNANVTSVINKINNTNYSLSSISTPILYKTSGISNKSSLYFNNNGLIASIPSTTFNNGISVFIVFKNISSNKTNLTLFNRTQSGSNFPQPISVYNQNRDFGINTITSSFNINTSTTSKIFYFNGTSTLQYNESVNGTVVSNTSITNYNDSGTQIHIGMVSDNTSNTNGFIGNISEILIFNKTLTTTERQNIEGYLAWKWALVTNLPTSHPYSNLNLSFTVPVNGYVGLDIPYQIILTGWTPNPNITNLYVQYNQNIIDQTNLVVIGNIPITQDENNNYKLTFTSQFPTTGTYYLYITDQYSYIYKSITTPIVITDGSSQISLTSNVSSINTGETLTLFLVGWSSLFQINNVNIYYSGNSNDPSPTFISNTSIQYSNNVYSVSFIVPITTGNIYFYVIGVNNAIQIFKKNIMITVIYTITSTGNISTYTNSIFNPNAIPSLTLWLDANEVSGSYLNQPNNTDPVLTWSDKSGNGYDAIAINTLTTGTFSVNGLNNLPCIVNNGGYVSSIPTGTFNTGMTIFIVYTSNYPYTAGALIGKNNGSNAAPFFVYNTTRWIGNGSNSDTLTTSIDPAKNGNYIFYANIDPNYYTYNESNLFNLIYKNTFNYWDDISNSDLYIGYNPVLNTFAGNISEILVFNEPITLEQKYNIEGYLAYKWNLQIYLPLSHPYSSIIPLEFTPLLFDTLQLWMDASNTNSYTIINTNQITQWNDSSYNKYIAVYNTGSPITVDTFNSKKVLVFNSTMTIKSYSSFVGPVSTSVLAFNNDITLMFLFKLPNTPVNSGSPFSVILGSNNDLFTSSNGNVYSSFGQAYSNIGTPDRGWIIYTVVVSSTGSSPTTTTYFNGVEINQNAYDSTYFNNFPTWYIGNNTPLVGTLAEMCVFSEAMSDQKRILMEGYLANKWGVTNLLPVGHAFANRLPNVTDFNDLLNEGLKMDLDANSDSNFTFSGNNILTWTDSTNNNNSLTTVNGLGTPTIQTNPVNGKRGVYFNNSSMIPSTNNQLVLNGASEFSIFTVGYITGSSSNTRPTILGSYYSNNNNYHLIRTRKFESIINLRSAPTSAYEYYIYVRKNTVDPLNQLVITKPNPANPALPYIVISGPLLTGNLENGLQNINSNTKIYDFNTNVNGNALVTNTNTMLQNDTFYTNFYLGGNSSDSNSFIQIGYIHKVLIYNRELDPGSRIKVDGQLAINWNVNSSNPYIKINNIKVYRGITTNINIILGNWSPNITSVYVGYNLSPSNINDIIKIGPFTVQSLNNNYYISCNIIFDQAYTYYFHILDNLNNQYLVCSKTITVLDISVTTVSSVSIIEGSTFNVELQNWKDIVNSIGLYSKQIYDFDLYIGTSNSDPSPVFVTNISINYINNVYVLSVPGLTNVNTKYLYFKKVVNNYHIDIPPILINLITLSAELDHYYAFINISETFNLTITSSINPFSSTYSSIYIYYSLIVASSSIQLSDLTLIGNVSVSGNNSIFSINLNYPNNTTIGIYMSTGVNFTGYTFYTTGITLYDYQILNANLDTYNINTNERNILLSGLPTELSSVNVLSGSTPDYNNQTYITSANITLLSLFKNLNLWLDATNSSNFIFNNNSISEWIDNSKNCNAISVSSPIYNEFEKGVIFNDNSYFNLSNGTIPYNQDYSIFIVITPDDNIDKQFILGSIDDNETNSLWVHRFNLKPKIKQLISIENMNEKGRIIYVNREIQLEENNILNENSMYNNLLGGLLNENTFRGLIHEILIFNKKISTEEKNTIEDYLNNKWIIF